MVDKQSKLSSPEFRIHHRMAEAGGLTPRLV